MFILWPDPTRLPPHFPANHHAQTQMLGEAGHHQTSHALFAPCLEGSLHLSFQILLRWSQGVFSNKLGQPPHPKHLRKRLRLVDFLRFPRLSFPLGARLRRERTQPSDDRCLVASQKHNKIHDKPIRVLGGCGLGLSRVHSAVGELVLSSCSWATCLCRQPTL